MHSLALFLCGFLPGLAIGTVIGHGISYALHHEVKKTTDELKSKTSEDLHDKYKDL